MKWTKTLILAASASLLLVSCGDGSKKPRVGLSLPTQQEERWVRDKNKMVEAAKKAGLDLRVQVADGDAAKQMSQCENLIAQGVKVLIIGPHDASSAAAIVNMAHRSGVKVICYDRLILGCEPELYVSFDNEKVGEIQATYLTKRVPKGRYVFLSGSPTDNNALLFRSGAMKVLKPLVDRGDVTIVFDQWVKGWAPAEAQKLMEQALTKAANRVDAVLAPNDGTAGGCIQALAAQGLAGKVPVTGQDAELAAALRIRKGEQTMTVFKDTRILGQKAIDAAVELLAGRAPAEVTASLDNGKIKVPSILLESVAVDAANLESVLIDSGYLKRADVIR